MVYDILPSENLEYSDIRDTLAANGGSVNNDISSAFKSSAKINPWSRNKPVGFSQNFTENYPNWYRGNDGKCGMDIAKVTNNVQDLIAQYKAGTWNYVPPKGGQSEPFRIGDFRGYDPNALPFFRSGLKKGESIEVNIERTNYTIISGQYSQSATALNISDFQQLGEGLQNAHLGVMIYNYDPEQTGGKVLYTSISNAPITDNGGVTLTFDGDDVGATRYAVLFLASTTVPNNICIPYTDTNYWNVKIDVVRKPVINLEIKGFGLVGGPLIYMDYWKTNPFPSNNGAADVLVNTYITNTLNEDVTIGTESYHDYNVRAIIESGRWAFDAIFCDSNGQSIGSVVTIKGNSSVGVYLRFNALFRNFVSSLSGTKGSTNFAIQVQSNRSSGLKGYQNVTPNYSILVSK